MEIPDIIGYTLGEAKEKLKGTDFNICNIRVTAPPRQKHDKYDESYRIVRLRVLDGKSIELVICKPL